MGLDFTNIKDDSGCAIYLIHDGTEIDKLSFIKLAETLKKNTTKQIVIMSREEKSADSIIKFYQLRGTHFVLIVRDDDQLHHVWSDGEHFDASQIAYLANQAG